LKSKTTGQSEKVDFWRIIAQSLHMGLTLSESKAQTFGEFEDLFDSYKEIYNMEIERKLYVIPDRLDRVTSMADL
jgi:hypothetical protein